LEYFQQNGFDTSVEVAGLEGYILYLMELCLRDGLVEETKL
jgi:hypothetical protein